MGEEKQEKKEDRRVSTSSPLSFSGLLLFSDRQELSLISISLFPSP